VKSLLSVALILLVAACAATGPNVSTNADPNTNFAAIQTFGFFQPLGTDRPGGVRTPLSNMLGSAVVRELEARGWQQSDNPDVLVNFFVNLQQRMDVRTTPTASSFHSYRRGRYRTWGGYETRVREFTQGTLSIDIIDPTRKMLVWEGAIQERLGRGDIEITQEMVNEAVGAVLAELPR
jgi:hypothetical protein